MKYFMSMVAFLSLTIFSPAEETVAQRVQDAQVTIHAGPYTGSGTLVTTKDGQTWVLSCGHLFEAVRSEREVYENGSRKTIIEFGTPKLYKTLTDGKQDTGRVELAADVIRYSDATYGQDLALLKVRNKGLLKQSIKFYNEDAPPAIDTDCYHCGSLQGELGSNSLTTGVVSRIGRLYADGKGPERVYDQTSCTAMPGSSGGPICLKKDGRYIGCLVRGAGETFNLFVPIRRIKDWAKDAKVEFILDPTKEVPTDEQLKKDPIEAHASASSKGGYSAKKIFGFFLFKDFEQLDYMPRVEK